MPDDMTWQIRERETPQPLANGEPARNRMTAEEWALHCAENGIPNWREIEETLNAKDAYDIGGGMMSRGRGRGGEDPAVTAAACRASLRGVVQAQKDLEQIQSKLNESVARTEAHYAQVMTRIEVINHNKTSADLDELLYGPENDHGTRSGGWMDQQAADANDTLREAAAAGAAAADERRENPQDLSTFDERYEDIPDRYYDYTRGYKNDLAPGQEWTGLDQKQVFENFKADMAENGMDPSGIPLSQGGNQDMSYEEFNAMLKSQGRNPDGTFSDIIIYDTPEMPTDGRTRSYVPPRTEPDRRLSYAETNTPDTNLAEDAFGRAARGEIDPETVSANPRPTLADIQRRINTPSPEYNTADAGV